MNVSKLHLKSQIFQHTETGILLAGETSFFIMRQRCTQNLFHYSFGFQIHKITEHLKLEATFNDQAPCHEEEYLLLNQVVLSPTQTEHEHFQ